MDLDRQFYAYADLLEKGDIIFTYNRKNLLSRLIYWFSRKNSNDPEVSHVLIHIGGWVVIEASNGGTKLNHIKKYTEKKYSVIVGYIDGADTTKLIDYALEQLDTPYATLQLFWIVLKKWFKIGGASDIQPDALICSELVCRSARASGVILGNGDSALQSPLELLKDRAVKIRYPSISVPQI